jgi:hypothetical protein
MSNNKSQTHVAEPGFARRSLRAGSHFRKGGGSWGNHGFPDVHQRRERS